MQLALAGGRLGQRLVVVERKCRPDALLEPLQLGLRHVPGRQTCRFAFEQLAHVEDVHVLVDRQRANDERTARLARVLDALTAAAGGAVATSEFRDNLRLFVGPDRLIAVLTSLRDEHGFALVEVGGTDYLGYPGRDPDRPRFEVHYCLLNRQTNDRLIVKCGVSDPDPTVPSVVPLWLGADWMEREVFDMFGVIFDGHPSLTRILMPDDWEGHPQRKSYPLGGIPVEYKGAEIPPPDERRAYS